MDDTDVEILKVIYEKAHNSLIVPLFLIEKFSISDEEIGHYHNHQHRATPLYFYRNTPMLASGIKGIRVRLRN